MFRIILIVVLIGFKAQAQRLSYEDDADRLSADFCKGRREAFRKQMPENSVAFFFSNPVRNRSNDNDYPYHQDPNFYYLTGLVEPNAVVVIYKDTLEFGSIKTNELLFIQPRNVRDETWNGKRLGVEGARKELKMDAVYLNTDFNSFDFKIKNVKKVIYGTLFSDITKTDEKGDLYELLSYFNTLKETKGVDFDSNVAFNILARLREVKTPEELVLMQKAIDLSCNGHRELMRALEPGFTEYKSQAIAEYYFKSGGAEDVGYPSIVGSQLNSCVLHYEFNRRTMVNGDLLLVDAAAEYHGYSADVTRTMPVNGKFSDEQKIIYNIVLEAQLAGINAARSGQSFYAPHIAASDVIKKRLKELGIINDESDYKLYFMHGTSHYLGLDVHDLGLHGLLAEGNVITVEPGIYIKEGSPCDKKWWNIGVRIEDDVLITKEDAKVLSNCVPKTIEEIEKVMSERSIFNEIR